MLHGNPSALERVLRPLDGRWPSDFARQLLTLNFSADEQSRYEILSDKAQQDLLSEAEKVELDDLLTANDVLAILQAKAQSSLGHATAG